MLGLIPLLLPALAGAVLVFIVSSIIHMFTKWHANDFSTLPNEDAVLAALRPFNLPPGVYAAPRPKDMKDMASPEYKAKAAQGPMVMLTVMPNGQTGMGQQLVLWFLYSFFVALFSGYVTSRAVGIGADAMVVFKFTACVAFAGFALALAQMSIWYRRPWLLTIKSTLDGVLYACITAAPFALLWPR